MKTKQPENLVEEIIVISETDSPVVVFYSNQFFERLAWDGFFAKYVRLNLRWKEVKTFLEENLNHLEVRKPKQGNAEFLYEAFGYDKDGGKQGIRFSTVET